MWSWNKTHLIPLFQHITWICIQRNKLIGIFNFYWSSSSNLRGIFSFYPLGKGEKTEYFKKIGKGNECSLMSGEGMDVFEQWTCYLNMKKKKVKYTPTPKWMMTHIVLLSISIFLSFLSVMVPNLNNFV